MFSSTHTKRLLGVVLAAVMVTATAVPALAFPTDGSDIDTITKTGVSLSIPQTLRFTAPTANLTTTASSYTVTGTSDPKQKLYMNGTEITTRGQQGSFAVTLNLAMGNNLIEIEQGDSKKAVYITRSASGGYSVATKITSAFPSTTQAVQAGDTITVSCTAPASSRVYVTIFGKQYELTQAVAGASKGIAAVFKASIVVPDSAAGVKNLGKVAYTLVNNGQTTTYQSAGNLMVAGAGSAIVVQSMQTATPVYTQGSNNASISSILRYGTVERVVEQNDTMYRISMGGWVSKTAVKPLEGNFAHKNKVTDTLLRKEEEGESFVLKGSSFPSFRVKNSDTQLVVTLYNTSGVDSMPTADSTIFSGATVTQQDGATILTFTKKSAKSLWGYGIEYNDGETVIFCKKPPKLSGDADQPLKGIIIALDPGHGDYDPGALGTAKTTGPMEKDLTLASALATKNRLEGMGATVIMSRTEDTNPTFNDRMFTAMLHRADFFISLHYNAALSTSAKGTEVYYYEDESLPFAQSVQKTLVDATGRYDRGAKYTPFRVVLNTYCPSILTEIGFITNPVEYDSICSRTNIYNVANGMAQGVLNMLS